MIFKKKYVPVFFKLVTDITEYPGCLYFDYWCLCVQLPPLSLRLQGAESRGESRVLWEVQKDSATVYCTWSGLQSLLWLLSPFLPIAHWAPDTLASWLFPDTPASTSTLTLPSAWKAFLPGVCVRGWTPSFPQWGLLWAPDLKVSPCLSLSLSRKCSLLKAQ